MRARQRAAAAAHVERRFVFVERNEQGVELVEARLGAQLRPIGGAERRYLSIAQPVEHVAKQTAVAIWRRVAGA